MVICVTAPPSHVKSLKEERWGLEQLKRKTNKYEKYAFSEIFVACGHDGLIGQNG